jgi:hypothetical protein
MKRAVLLSVFSVILLVSKSEAQHFVTSYGVEQRWGIPYEVYYTLDHDFWGYDIVHASHVVNRRHNYFDVVLQRRGVFVRLSIGRNGRVFRRIVTNDYPLFDHACTNHCGFHDTFYHNYAVNDGHGHFHVNYRRPRPNVVVYNDHHHYKKGHGHAYGNNKGKKHDNHGDNYSHRNNDRNDDRRVVEGSRSGNRGGNGQSRSGAAVNRSDNSRNVTENNSSGRNSSTSSSNSSKRTSASTSYPSRRSN